MKFEQELDGLKTAMDHISHKWSIPNLKPFADQSLAEIERYLVADEGTAHQIDCVLAQHIGMKGQGVGIREFLKDYSLYASIISKRFELRTLFWNAWTNREAVRTNSTSF